MKGQPSIEQLQEKIKELETALEDSKIRQQALSEVSFEAVFLSDRGICIDQNKTAQRLFGYTLSEAVGRPGTDWIHPKDRDRVKKHMKNNHCDPYEVTALRRDGTTFPCEIQAETLQYKGKEIRCTALRDISARKGVEYSLKQSEERLRQVVENMPVMMDALDDQYNIIRWNRECERVTGYSAREIVNNPRAIDILYPDPEYRRKVNASFDLSHDFRDREFILTAKDGSLKTIAWSNISSTHPIPGWHTWAIGIDITERKQTEIRFMAQKQKAEQYLALAGVMFISLDKKGVVTLVNKKALEILGCRESEVIGRDWFETFVPGRARKKVKAAFREMISGNIRPMEYYENSIISRTGKEKVIAWHNAHMKGRGGEITGIISSGEDITEKRELAAQLQQAQKMESIGNLAGGIAHDFNNILYPIVGMAELLMEDLPVESSEYRNLKEILSAGLRGSELVKQILTFSRQSKIKKAPVQIQKIITEVLRLTRSAIPANIEIETDVQGDCPKVMADPTQLHQVSMNLLTNAYHVLEGSGGTIYIRLREKELVGEDMPVNSIQPGRYALLSIEDTGPGVDPQILDLIFEPYFTTKDKGKGTGLGLAVAYGIIKEHQGHIHVETKPGKGARFNIYLPLIKPSPVPRFQKIRDIKDSGNERILLVDDEESIVLTEAKILERLGYRVTPLTDSCQALELFAACPHDFDLVITDMTMPGMTGDRLAGEILGIRKEIPIIICTGFSEQITEETAKQMGVKGFLMKPVVKSELNRMIRQVMEKSLENEING